MALHRTALILFLLPLFSALPSFSLQVSRANGAAMPPVLTIARPAFDAEAERLFDEALNKIWMMTGAGTQEYEAGFALNRVGDHYEVVYAPMTYERNMELKIPVNTAGITVAIAHTHPNCREDVPSGEAHHARGQGDVYSPVPNFVVSRSGLWVTDPSDHSFKHISGQRWRRNLPALELASVSNGSPATLEAMQPIDELPASGPRTLLFAPGRDLGP